MIADQIEREIKINAPLERVWELVTVPGWWIGDGDLSIQTRSQDGETFIVDDPKYGRFFGKTVSIDPPAYASYRWAAEFQTEIPSDGNSTLVEYFVTAEAGGTRLRVIESGFVSLAITQEARDKAIDGNTEGWEQQLGIIKAWAEQVAG